MVHHSYTYMMPAVVNLYSLLFEYQVPSCFPRPHKMLEKLSQQAIANKAFASWFSGSKLVDCNGLPLPMLHGTVKDFEKFSPSKLNTSGTAVSVNYLGVYLTTAPEAADVYVSKHWERSKGYREGAHSKLLFANCKKMFPITETGYWKLTRLSRVELDDYKAELTRRGYDSILMPSVWRGREAGGWDIVVFDNTKIIPATTALSM